MNLPAYCLHDPCIDSSLQITSRNLMSTNNFLCSVVHRDGVRKHKVPSLNYFSISWVTLSFLLLSSSPLTSYLLSVLVDMPACASTHLLRFSVYYKRPQGEQNTAVFLLDELSLQYLRSLTQAAHFGESR